MMLSPRSLAACSFLPPEMAAPPAARQSRFRGSDWCFAVRVASRIRGAA